MNRYWEEKAYTLKLFLSCYHNKQYQKKSSPMFDKILTGRPVVSKIEILKNVCNHLYLLLAKLQFLKMLPFIA
eukprot:UN22137